MSQTKDNLEEMGFVTLLYEEPYPCYYCKKSTSIGDSRVVTYKGHKSAGNSVSVRVHRKECEDALAYTGVVSITFGPCECRACVKEGVKL